MAEHFHRTKQFLSSKKFPYCLVVRIPGFHPGGPGSIPGMGKQFTIYRAVRIVYMNRVGERSLATSGPRNCTIKGILRSWQDSNLQSSDPKSDALSIRPHDLVFKYSQHCWIENQNRTFFQGLQYAIQTTLFMILKCISYFEGLDRELNPGPLAPEARIIPLDHRANITINVFAYASLWECAIQRKLVRSIVAGHRSCKGDEIFMSSVKLSVATALKCVLRGIQTVNPESVHGKTMFYILLRGHSGSNRGPPDLQSDALPLSYTPLTHCYVLHKQFQNVLLKYVRAWRVRMNCTKALKVVNNRFCTYLV